jgi:hypothetical protein
VKPIARLAIIKWVRRMEGSPFYCDVFVAMRCDAMRCS